MAIVLDGTTNTVTPLNGALGGTTPSTVVATSVNTPNTFGFKNLLIDAGFTINQRGYVSGATLASGSYGHDRWKAGASGGDYTYTQLASSTTITIASGKSLIQVVEDKNVEGTSFVLSWTGTAQARYAVNGATPSGSYAASPILITGQTVGTTMSVEFNTGTLSKPQLELGSTATSFDVRDYGRELIMCQRYYQKLNFSLYSGLVGFCDSTTSFIAMYTYPVTMYAAPTLGTSGTASDYLIRRSGSAESICNAVPAIESASTNNLRITATVASGLTAGQGAALVPKNNPFTAANAYLAFSAEL